MLKLSRYSKKNFFGNISYLFLFVGMIQGISYGALYPLISERKFFIFRLTPFNLFPTDLMIFPIAIVIAFIAINQYKGFPKVKIGMTTFFFVFWLISIHGIIIGYSRSNEYLFGDLKNLFVRSLFAPLIYFVCRYVDVNKLKSKILNISTFLALFLVIRNFLALKGIYLESIIFDEYKQSIWPEMTMLFPYSLLLVKFFSGSQFTRMNKIQLIVITLSCFSDLWKPNVAAFLICTLITFIVSLNKKRGRKTTIARSISLAFLLLIFLLSLFFITGSDSNVIQMIENTYLKRNAAVVDLSGGRFQIISMAIEKWYQFPIFGNGLGDTISGQFFDAGLGKFIFIDRIYPHNLPIQILFQLGLVGIVVMSLLVIVALKKYFSCMGLVLPYEMDNYLGLGAYCLTLLVISFFSEVITSEVTGYFFWISLGLISTIIFRGKIFNLSKRHVLSAIPSSNLENLNNLNNN